MIQFSYRLCQLVLQLQLQLQLQLRVLLECSLYSNTRCCPYIQGPIYFHIVSVCVNVRLYVCPCECPCACVCEKTVTLALPVGPLCRRAAFALGFSFIWWGYYCSLAFVFILTHFCSNFAAGLDWFGDFIGWLVGTKVLDMFASLAGPRMELCGRASHAIGSYIYMQYI